MVVLRPLWCPGTWTQLGMDLIPSLLGFSIGAMAIMLALPGMPVFKFLADDGAPDSKFMEMASRLIHFIVVQVISIAMVFVAKAYPSGVTNGIGFLFMMYALFSAVAAGLSIFGLARALNFSAPSSD